MRVWGLALLAGCSAAPIAPEPRAAEVPVAVIEPTAAPDAEQAVEARLELSMGPVTTARWRPDDAASAPLDAWAAEAYGRFDVFARRGDKLRIAVARGDAELWLWVNGEAADPVLGDDTPFSAEPGGPPSGTLASGTLFTVLATEGAHTRVEIYAPQLSSSITLQGWVPTSSLGHSYRVAPPLTVEGDDLELAIPMRASAELRAQPDGRVIATLEQGIMALYAKDLGARKQGMAEVRMRVRTDDERVVARVDGWLPAPLLEQKPAPPTESLATLSMLTKGRGGPAATPNVRAGTCLYTDGVLEPVGVTLRAIDADDDGRVALDGLELHLRPRSGEATPSERCTPHR